MFIERPADRRAAVTPVCVHRSRGDRLRNSQAAIAKSSRRSVGAADAYSQPQPGSFWRKTHYQGARRRATCQTLHRSPVTSGILHLSSPRPMTEAFASLFEKAQLGDGVALDAVYKL